MSSSTAPTRPARFSSLLSVIGAAMALVTIVSWVSTHRTADLHVSTSAAHQQRMAEFVGGRKARNSTTGSSTDVRVPLLAPPVFAQLDCSPFDKTTRSGSEYAQEMVYWKEIAADEMNNPFRRRNQKSQPLYMTFEPDGGGFNNIRMAMETVVALAVASGRTLVLPAEQRMYLLAKNRGKQKTDFGFNDFFAVEQWKHGGVDIISMEQFLERTMGQMRYKANGTIAYPPDNNRTDWNGKDVKQLKEWLRQVTQTVHWQPGQCLAVFGEADFEGMLADLIMKNRILRDSFLDTLLPMDASAALRMREHLAMRKKVCRYNSTLQEAPVLHFMCSHKDKVRLLVHFYAFVFFDDWKADLWMKRFIRDHVRFTDEIQCAAARIVREMRKLSPHGIFDALHVRRGDFQYKHTRISAEEILTNIKETIPQNSSVYIATDERDKKFFKPLTDYYNVKFMDDFTSSLTDVNHNFFGMIDQLVASRSRTFFGCWHSTFTGYIMRLRGYHSRNPDGILPDSYYYVPQNAATNMHRYAPLQGAFFNREFPTAWRQLDYGLE